MPSTRESNSFGVDALQLLLVSVGPVSPRLGRPTARQQRAAAPDVIPTHRDHLRASVIEYDGPRDHSADCRRCDTDKAAALLGDGWGVVRIQERAVTRTLGDLALASSDLAKLSHWCGDSLVRIWGPYE